jgi:CO/xanthine dehydrogenase FAD-binding subunit
VLTPASSDDDAVRSSVREATFEPPSDVHASSEYRTHLAEVLALRAVAQAKEAA